jgi:Cof subfamily protein (haloacid dehalogenase superfamily)
MSTLYISDLDGTLLRPDATLSDFSRETLNTLIEQGLQFTVASARSVASMQPILDGLHLRLPVIEFNGGLITDLHTGEHYTVNAIHSDIAPQILQQARRVNCDPFVSTFDGTRNHLYYQQIRNGGMDFYLRDRKQAQDPRLRHCHDLTQTLQEQVLCFTIIGREDNLTDLAQSFLGSFAGAVELQFYENQYSPGWHWLTVHDHRADKALAIQTLTEMNGLKPQEIVAFGDQANDIGMLKAAGRGIAVANAVSQVKACASQIIGSNQEDSVVKFIASDWRNNDV